MVKIQFSPAESRLMNDAAVILTKNTVLHKVRQLFMHLQAQMQNDVESYVGKEVFAIPPKISRGENYLGLPYVILDYPRIFRQGNIAAIRSMFWWGHYFSSTLHLGGIYKNSWQNRAEHNYDLFASRGYLISVHEDQWLHQFEPEVYRPVAELTRQEYMEQCRKFDHLKIGTTHPLKDGGEAGISIMKSWKELLETVIV